MENARFCSSGYLQVLACSFRYCVFLEQLQESWGTVVGSDLLFSGRFVRVRIYLQNIRRALVMQLFEALAVHSRVDTMGAQHLFLVSSSKTSCRDLLIPGTIFPVMDVTSYITKGQVVTAWRGIFKSASLSWYRPRSRKEVLQG